MRKLGIPPENLDPLRYSGPRLNLTPVTEANRRPAIYDRDYPLNTYWRTRAPTQDGSVEGELWYLSRFDTGTGDAIWLMLSTGGSGPAISFETDDGAPNVVPDGVGAVQILGGAGIDVTGQGPGNTVTVALTGGGVAVDSILVNFDTAPGVQPVTPDGGGTISIFGNTVANATNLNSPVATHTRALNQFDIDVQVAAAIAPTPADSDDAGLASFNNTQFTTDINGFTSLIGGANLPVLQTLTGNTGGAVGPDGAGNIDFVGIGETTVAGTPGSNLLEIFSPRTAQFVVDPVANIGTHTTIQSAINDAVSGELIFVRPGVYTENLTLKAGVNLFTDGSAAIVGEMTANYAGTVRLTGFVIQTNGDYFITQTGASACALVLFNCFLNCTNFNGIFSDNTAFGSGIELYQCVSAISATRTLFEFGGTTLYISGCDFTTGVALSSVASTFSGVNPGVVIIRDSRISFPISTSSTAGIQVFNSVFDTSAVNATCLTINNSNGFLSFKNTYRSGTATAITVTSTMSSYTDTVSSTNATVIGGAGTLTYSLLNFTNGTTIGTTTQVGGQYIGWRTNTAPAAGFIGEQVRSFIGTGAAVALTNGTNTNLTSISLTAGIWDVSLNAGFTGSPTGTQAFAGISTVSATPNADVGDSGNSTPTMPTAGSNNFINIPQYRMAIATTTTVYAVVRVAFTVGAVSAFGRISAKRVG